MKSTRQNTTSHVTVKQYMEGVMHSDRDTEMQHVVGAPKKKMATKVSKEPPKAVKQQHIYVKRDNAHCTSS